MTNMKVTLSRGRALSGGSVWTINLYRPGVGGQRIEIKTNGIFESPVPTADRRLAEEGLRAEWIETPTGAFVGVLGSES